MFCRILLLHKVWISVCAYMYFIGLPWSLMQYSRYSSLFFYLSPVVYFSIEINSGFRKKCCRAIATGVYRAIHLVNPGSSVT